MNSMFIFNVYLLGIPIILDFIRTYEAYYPDTLKNIICVNGIFLVLKYVIIKYNKEFDK